jgi:hypothetical protein
LLVPNMEITIHFVKTKLCVFVPYRDRRRRGVSRRCVVMYCLY